MAKHEAEHYHSIMQAQARHVQNDFPSGDGEMAARIREFDWSTTAIGRPENWSPALRTLVPMLLANRFPLLLWWGSEYISIYNDAYSPILGRKHPWGLGRPVRECWSEIWDVLKPLIDTPFQGGPATWIEDIELQINRIGFTEETHFTVAYSPVPDDTVRGGIGGVLATVHEITEKVIGERRGAILHDLSSRGGESKTAEEACATAAATLANYAKDIPFGLIYLINPDGNKATLVASYGVEAASGMATSSIELGANLSHVWPLSTALRTNAMQLVRNLGAVFRVLPSGTWTEPPHTAVVVPIRSHIAHQLAGFFVAGLSSHLKFDEPYRTFVDLVASQIATAITNARTYEVERRRAEALAEIDRAKTAFFSNVSHEFRTPLTLMLGPLENVLAKNGAISLADRQELETAHRNSLRLLKLVNSLLDFSRIEAGRVKAAYAPVDLAALTIDLASNFRSAMEAGGLELVVDCPPLTEYVFVDREMWEKIVLNLLSNAFKFTLEGTVRVSLEACEGQAVLTVADTGIGIPEAELPHIFERFYRVEGTGGRTYEGTGIGLALIQELVKLHGGMVEVMSRPGQGSAFAVKIPFGSEHLPLERIGIVTDDSLSTAVRAEAYTSEAETWIVQEHVAYRSEEIISAKTSSSSINPTPRSRILLADDNSDMREYVCNILGPNYDVVAVHDGHTALEQARKARPDLVLTDAMMPGLDGFGLLRELRREAQLREVPIILFSARAGEEARTEGIAAGADDYLTKPFSGRELSARVETTLNLQRVRREAREQVESVSARLQSALKAARMIAWEWAPRSGQILYSENASEVLGSPLPRTAKAALVAVHPEDQPQLRAKIEEAIKDAGDFTSQFRHVRTDTGTMRWMEIHGRLLRNEEGRVHKSVGVLVDISAAKANEEELRRVNQDLEQFAHSASHDLQEPLRSVKIYSELLEQRYRSRLDGQALEFLDFIRGGANRMETMVCDLLTYTRATRGQKPSAAASSMDSLQAALANLAGAIAESAATVTFGPLPSVRVHGTHLQQLFQNLIGNAIKYRRMGVSPVIHVAALRQNGNWRFSVSDNGIGIETQFKERIFGLFKRLHTREEYPGSGIGLAICQRIVERYYGRIWVESEPGKGSTFIFTIPT